MAVKIFPRRMMGLKYEFKVNTSAKDTISVRSFNYHEQFFAENFTLKSPGEDELIFTGCAGFGLERVPYTFLCQNGPDMKHWPETIRNALNEELIIQEVL